MFFDEIQIGKTRPAAFTLQDFIAWLETLDPAQEYDFTHCGGECLMGLYMAARGRAWGNGLISYGSNYWLSCEQVFGKPAEAGVLFMSPRTFGAALARARAAL